MDRRIAKIAILSNAAREEVVQQTTLHLFQFDDDALGRANCRIHRVKAFLDSELLPEWRDRWPPLRSLDSAPRRDDRPMLAQRT